MGRLLHQGLVLTTYTAVLLMQVNGAGEDSCQGEDLFWDVAEGRCRTCTRCGIGMESTAVNCGYGKGSQGECRECPAEKYQDEAHSKAACRPCVQCDREGGLELAPCTGQQDRTCGCQAGFGINPYLDNTCIKCDLWSDDKPLEGCINTPTPELSKMPSGQITAANTPIAAGVGGVSGNQSLADAAVITISIIGAVAIVFFITVAIFCVVYHFCGLKEKRKQPPVRINAGGPPQMTDNNGNQTLYTISSTPIPSITFSEEGTPLMTGKTNESNCTNASPETFNSSGGSARNAPLLQLKNMEMWTPHGSPRGTPLGTPRGTPKGTPRGSPSLFRRSISEPYGDKSYCSANGFSPVDSTPVQEESDQSLALPDKARKGAIQCEEQMKLQQMREEKQKARSIGARNPLHEFVQDFNATQRLSQMLEIQEGGVRSDWRHLAAEWKYSNSDIAAMKEITKRAERTGLALLFDKENAEHFGMKNLEHLLDDLEKIKREDAVQFLAKYLINSETIL